MCYIQSPGQKSYFDQKALPSLYLDGWNKYVHYKSSPNINFIRRQDQNNYFDTETRANYLDIFNMTINNKWGTICEGHDS